MRSSRVKKPVKTEDLQQDTEAENAPREKDSEEMRRATRACPPQDQPAPPTGSLEAEVKPPQPRSQIPPQIILRVPSYKKKTLDYTATTPLILSRLLFLMIL